MNLNFSSAKWLTLCPGILLMVACSHQPAGEKVKDVLAEGSFSISKDLLQDKIKGGWAGQTIGVVYGAPVEFKYQGSIIDRYQNIPWDDHYVKYWWDKKPGLFDDIYTDLNFVRVFDQQGIHVSTDSIAHHWAATAYHLAHANQASRYNILNGMKPPMTGNWKNNPHADDLDFQIESDFIGLMTPGMVKPGNEHRRPRRTYHEQRRWVVWGSICFSIVFTGVRFE